MTDNHGRGRTVSADPMTPDMVNTRARDLVDLLLLEPLVADRLTDVREACEDVFTTRARHAWPPVLHVPPIWSELYSAAAEGLEGRVPTDVGEASGAVQQLIDRMAAA